MDEKLNLTMLVDFYEFTMKDIKLVDYQYHDKIEMEVAV